MSLFWRESLIPPSKEQEERKVDNVPSEDITSLDAVCERHLYGQGSSPGICQMSGENFYDYFFGSFLLAEFVLCFGFSVCLSFGQAVGR